MTLTVKFCPFGTGSFWGNSAPQAYYPLFRSSNSLSFSLPSSASGYLLYMKKWQSSQFLGYRFSSQAPSSRQLWLSNSFFLVKLLSGPQTSIIGKTELAAVLFITLRFSGWVWLPQTLKHLHTGGRSTWE